METPAAKRPQFWARNAEEIILDQRRVIENQKQWIQQLEEQEKNSKLSAKETKIKNVAVPELPNEIWLKIMSYLSTFDVLRNVAQVS